MSNDRIPRGIRKVANRISPGKYMDPSNGRVYIDSADMDDAFEEMIDDTANADAKRIAEYDANRKLPRPPPELQEIAGEHLRGHASRMLQRHEDTSWQGRASKRRDLLLARKAWKESVGQTLDEDDRIELEELQKALPNEQENEDDERGTTEGG